MTQAELRYDDRVEQMMQSINDGSSVYITEGVKAEPPAIGALRFHRTDSKDVQQGNVLTSAKNNAPDGVGCESELLGDKTVEVRVYEQPR